MLELFRCKRSSLHRWKRAQRWQRSMARLDEAEDKVLEVIAQSLEKATEVVGETCMSGASRYLRELERRNSARAATTDKQ